MQRIIRFLICLFGMFGAIMALAQTPLPVQGNLTSIIGAGQQYAGVTIQLQNCPSPASIAGYSAIVQTGYVVQANGAGLVNTSVWPNDLITCHGSTGNSQYQLAFTANGSVQGTPQCYQVLSTQGTWNLNTQQPISCSQTPPDPQDAQYRNLNVTGCFSVSGGPCGGSGAEGVSQVNVGLGLAVSPSGGTGHVTLSSTGVTRIIPGNLITVSPSGGSGDTTVNVDPTWSATLGTIAGSSDGYLAYYQGAGNHLNGVSRLPIVSGGSGATTAAGALVAFGAQAYGGVGIPYAVNATTARLATLSDFVAQMGYQPLNPASNLTDVANALTSLKNLLSSAGLTGASMLGSDSSGNPIPIIVGNGLTYTPSAGSGSVVSLSITNFGGGYTTCPTISFSGGGGSGAAGTITCIDHGVTAYVQWALLTNGGSGYSSAPTVTVSGGGSAAITAILGTGGTLQTSWQSGTVYSVAGTALPSCASTTLLQRLAVSDATSATPGTTYAGGGPYTIPVECIFNATGSVYSWIVD